MSSVIISQYLVDTAIDQFSKRLTLVKWSFVLEEDISPELGLIRHKQIVIKLCGILQN